MKYPEPDPIIRIKYSLDHLSGELNCSLLDPSTGQPMRLSERAIDDALAAVKLGFDGGPLNKLMGFRNMRQAVIDRHFRDGALQLIAQIEAKEDWKKFDL